MGKSYLGDDDGDLDSGDDYDSSDSSVETPKRDARSHGRYAARQRLDSRKDELWLKRQLDDWDDFDDGGYAG